MSVRFPEKVGLKSDDCRCHENHTSCDESSHTLPNVRSQPRDERLSKTEKGRAIALRCDAWLAVFFVPLLEMHDRDNSQFMLCECVDDAVGPTRELLLGFLPDVREPGVLGLANSLRAPLAQRCAPPSSPRKILNLGQ
jgi:hypothetical protein